MKTILMLFAMNRGYKAPMALRIASLIFLLLCGCAIIYGGVKSGYGLWIGIGAYLTIVTMIALAIIIIINFRKNRPL